MKRTAISLIVVILFSPIAAIQNTKEPSSWAKTTLTTMTLEEKIGQLFIAATTTSDLTQPHSQGLDWIPQLLKDKIDQNSTEFLIQNYHIGGLLFLGNGCTPEKQLHLTNQYQSMSKYPLLIAQDLEWGLSMRLQNVIRYPRNMTLGALQDNNLIYELGKEIGRQTTLIGVHINFAPVIDVNNNPDNPVINDRSFGQDPENVARKGSAFMKGLQDAGIISCAKHFPGHGDTATDSHLTLPCIHHGCERLDAVELYPFKKLINSGVRAVMTAHLEVPALEKTPKLPATLSKAIVTELLRKKLGFNGLIITDSLAMDGVVNQCGPGEAELRTLLAGNDILLAPTDVPRAVTLIKKALTDGSLSQETLDAHVLKILQAKEWIHADVLASEDALPQLTTNHAKNLQQALYEQAITIVTNNKVLPLTKNSAALIVSVGNPEDNLFVNTLAEHMALETYTLPANAHTHECLNLFGKMPHKETIIICLHSMNKYKQHHFGVAPDVYTWINNLAKTNNVVLVIFGSPYSLAYCDKDIASIIVAYEDLDITHIAAARVLTGTLHPKGKLPVSAGIWNAGQGILV